MTEKKERLFHFRMTDRERAALAKMAEADGIRDSQLMRDLLRREAQQRQVWPPAPAQSERAAQRG